MNCSVCRELNAFIYDATVLEYIAARDKDCKLRTVGKWYAMTGYGIAFQKGSKWVEDFNKQLVRFQNDGESRPPPSAVHAAMADLEKKRKQTLLCDIVMK